MTMTSTPGGDCPPWCVTDHAKYGFHGSERISVTAADCRTYHANVVRFSDGDHIAVAGAGQFYVSPETAVDLAGLIESVAALFGGAA